MTDRVRKGRRSADPRQADFLALLDLPGAALLPAPIPASTLPGGLDFAQRMRQLLNDAIKAGPFADRETLAEAVSIPAGRTITKAMIDSWTGASRPHHFPADMVPAFCAALGNSILLQGLAEAAGCTVAEGWQVQQARLDRLRLFIQYARGEQRRIVAGLPLFRQGGAR
jgi:hypothetical protein